MDTKIQLDNCSVKITSSKLFSKEVINRLSGKHDKVQDVIFGDGFQIIRFSSQAEAKRCVHYLLKHMSKERPEESINPDPDCIGDTISKSNQTDSEKMKTVIKNLVRVKVKNRDDLMNETASSSRPPSKSKTNWNQFLPNCSSPVLLSTADPGFRLAYCHNASAFKPETNPQRQNSFNQSIKKYMDSAPKAGSQELVLINLPPDFKKEDVYRLCGKIEPAEVDLRTTSNINVLYVNVKAKSIEDFEKLREVLCNCQVNGKKITIIPVTKINQDTD